MEEKCKMCKKKMNLEDLLIYKNGLKYFFLCTECQKKIMSLETVEIEQYLKHKKNEKSEYNKTYKQKHKDKNNTKEYNKKYREEHREYYKEYNKKYREEHREYFAQKQRDKRKNNKKPAKAKNEELEKIKARTRCLINKCFVRKGFKKGTKTQKILGCDFETFNNYLLQTFKDNYGIEWDGIENVDIDHIKPLATAKTEEDVIRLCHYSNLQLLKREDNRKKGKKYI